jgi:AcrR family transcriptional regulator
VTSSRQAGGDSAGDFDEGERTRLTRVAVVDRALALADASGLDALTIRKLATELGVTPMALYWHFRGKEELLEGLTDRIWCELDTTVDAALPWPDQIRALLTSLVGVLRAHPAAAQLLAASDKNGAAALNAIEVTLELLRTAGFSPQEASAVARSALWTGIMLVMSEPGFKSLDGEERVEVQRKKQVVLATLPPSRFPRLVECAIPMTACDDPETHYQFGIDMFIAGVTAMASRPAVGKAGQAG